LEVVGVLLSHQLTKPNEISAALPAFANVGTLKIADAKTGWTRQKWRTRIPIQGLP